MTEPDQAQRDAGNGDSGKWWAADAERRTRPRLGPDRVRCPALPA